MFPSFDFSQLVQPELFWTLSFSVSSVLLGLLVLKMSLIVILNCWSSKQVSRFTAFALCISSRLCAGMQASRSPARSICAILIAKESSGLHFYLIVTYLIGKVPHRRSLRRRVRETQLVYITSWLFFCQHLFFNFFEVRCCLLEKTPPLFQRRDVL